MELNRREMLRSTLGAAAAGAVRAAGAAGAAGAARLLGGAGTLGGLAAATTLSGCQSPGAAAAVPPGELADEGLTAGHRLRDTAPPDESQIEEWRDVDVLIVGGGIAGLSAAWRLARLGRDDFAVLELGQDPGGTARSGRFGELAFPWGAHYLPAPQASNGRLVELLEEMKVVIGRDERGEPIVDEECLCREPQERLFYQGKWHDDLEPWDGAEPAERRQWDEFQAEARRWAEWRDAAGRPAFALPIATCSDAPEVRELDRVSMAEWLDARGWNSPRVRWLIEYACRDDYGAKLDRTSAWAGLFYFASRLANSAAAAQPLITWPEGNGRIVAHLASVAGQRLHVARVARRITRESQDDRYRIICERSNGGGGYEGWRARRVIWAVPQFIAARVIDGYGESRGGLPAEFHYGSWLVANLLLRDRPREHDAPLSWDNVLYDSPSLGYVTATHQRGIDHGRTVLTYYYALCGDDPVAVRRQLLSMSREEAAEAVITDLAAAHADIRGLVERIDVLRWGHAMIQPRPGFIWGDARKQAAQPLGGIHFAHTELSGVALLEEAFFHGVRAAEECAAIRA